MVVRNAVLLMDPILGVRIAVFLFILFRDFYVRYFEVVIHLEGEAPL